MDFYRTEATRRGGNKEERNAMDSGRVKLLFSVVTVVW